MSEYYNIPTSHQLASYGIYVMHIICRNDGNDNVDKLQELMDLGLSPNACNVHGESIIHNVCRRSNLPLFQVLLQAGCDVRISDDNGRTPLHDACWAAEPNFDLIETLLGTDINLLFLADKHGHLPLSYTHQDQWDVWLQFLQSKKDVFWPILNKKTCDSDGMIIDSLSTKQNGRRSVPDPKHNLSHFVCVGIANGTIRPCDVQYYLNHNIINIDDSSFCSDDDDESVDSDDDYDDEDDHKFEDVNDNDDDSIHFCHKSGAIHSCRGSSTSCTHHFDESWNMDEMNDILESISSPIRRPLAW